MKRGLFDKYCKFPRDSATIYFLVGDRPIGGNDPLVRYIALPQAVNIQSFNDKYKILFL